MIAAARDLDIAVVERRRLDPDDHLLTAGFGHWPFDHPEIVDAARPLSSIAFIFVVLSFEMKIACQAMDFKFIMFRMIMPTKHGFGDA